MRVALFGVDEGLPFVSGSLLDDGSAGQVPAEPLGRSLGPGDLQKLERMLLKKKRHVFAARSSPAGSASHSG